MLAHASHVDMIHNSMTLFKQDWKLSVDVLTNLDVPTIDKED